MSELKKGGLDLLYGAGPYEQQQLGTTGVEGVKVFEILTFICLCFSVVLHRLHRQVVTQKTGALPSVCFKRFDE